MVIGTLILAGGTLSAVAYGASYANTKLRRFQHRNLKSFLTIPSQQVNDADTRVSSNREFGIVPAFTDMLTRQQSLGREVAVIGLTGATALIHLDVGLAFGSSLLVWNGLGFAGLLTARYIPQLERYQGLLRDTLIGYTAVTFAAYFLTFGIAGSLTYGLGVVTKLIEAGLITILWIERQRQPLPVIELKTPRGEGGGLRQASVSAEVPREEVAEQETAAASTPEASAQVPPESGQLDRFEDITGIGPAYANRLREAGIMTFAALAESTLEQIREVINSPNVEAESWIAKARELASGGE